MAVIDCHEIRGQILTQVKQEVQALPTKPRLTIITIGEDDASQVYVRNKIKTATGVGIEVDHVKLPETITQEEAENQIIELIVYDNPDAVMLQLPIPKHLDDRILINLIPQTKDVDGLTDLNMGMLVNGSPYAIVPATAMGVYTVIASVLGNDLSGVNVAVINRSRLIGKPLQALLTNHNATVTLCHSHTDPLNHYTWNSHVVVTGVGKPKFFDNTDFTFYQLIVDCGINRDEDGKLCGDVDSESLSSFGQEGIGYTPVPGGVGILTTACLMKSVVQCYNLQH
jgi:methylenetetrahydrofolate dehydrogenase (NADP+)/methenyltetrahydrofolate cyclohydrolase